MNYVKKVPVRALVQTSKQTFIGYLHIQPGFRVKDVINRIDEEFIALTDATVVGRDEKIKFLLVQRREIIWLAPLDDEATGSGGTSG